MNKILPKEPPVGLLMSMAMRYDHGLGCPGYYDQDHLRGDNNNATHKQVLASTIMQMRKIYEEVAGYGFYSPEKEEAYRDLYEYSQVEKKKV